MNTRRQRWSRKSRMILMESLEMYIGSGMTVSQAIQFFSFRKSEKKKAQLDHIRFQIDAGQSVSNVFSREFGYPSAVISLIQCGELSGSLAKTLKSAHSLLEREDELIKKCVSAMTYPIVIGFAALALTIGLVRGIMPQIIPMLMSLHAKLPFITILVMNASDFLMRYGLAVFGSVTIITIVGIAAIKKYVAVRNIFQTALLRIPLIGSLVRLYSLSVFLHSFGLLCEEGMNVTDAYKKCVNSIGIIPLQSLLSSKEVTLQNGGKVSQICDSGMPRYVEPLITAGEASGHLAKSLIRTATLIDREIDHSLKRLTSLIEPIMMVAMGTIVGSIALSIMLPIYDISKTLQR